jgi:hypothetical protein
MSLHTLYACGNDKITDEGIKHMSLHTLDARWNVNITDEGIKHSVQSLKRFTHHNLL